MQPSRGHRRLAWKAAAGTLVISVTLIAGLGAEPLGWWWPATLVGLLMLQLFITAFIQYRASLKKILAS
jgi:hypothetical protein